MAEVNNPIDDLEYKALFDAFDDPEELTDGKLDKLVEALRKNREKFENSEEGKAKKKLDKEAALNLLDETL